MFYILFMVVIAFVKFRGELLNVNYTSINVTLKTFLDLNDLSSEIYGKTVVGQHLNDFLRC